MSILSVILPTYNGEKYIKYSIESILKQEFADFELVIINDCSTDSTFEIINEYARKDSRIKIINNIINQKLPKSLNIGFANATGEYLTWTSDDNIYLPGAFQNMYEKLRDNENIYMVCADMEIVDNFGNVSGIAIKYEDELLCFMNNIGACFMYKRAVYDIIGNYRSDMYYVEDYDYWLRIYKKIGGITRIDKILYQYRRHNDSLSFTKMNEVCNQLMKLRKNNLNFILEQLENRKTLICQMYYEFIENNEDMNDIQYLFEEYIPEIKFDKKIIDMTKKYIIFGAGNVGKEVAISIGEAALCFVDNNVQKIGDTKCGLKIISFNEMKEKYRGYTIIIATTKRYVYEIMHQVYENGFRDYCTYTVFTNV